MIYPTVLFIRVLYDEIHFPRLTNNSKRFLFVVCFPPLLLPPYVSSTYSYLGPNIISWLVCSSLTFIH